MSEKRITVGETADGAEMSLPVVQVLTGRAFATGKSGSGKSNTASVIAEELLEAGYPVMLVDTDGEYYGLKEQYELLHAGADEECDIQVDPEHAERLAALALEENVPIILDVSGYLDEEEAGALIRETARHLFAKEKKLKKPFLLVVEEIHEYLPEGAGMDETGKMLIKIGKRGRKHGLGILGISQRPADVKKDFITQANWLVWHRLTWDNDTQVVKRIVGGEYGAAVSELGDGEAFVQTDWTDDDVRRVQFRRKRTFDAGATPGLEDFQRPELKSVSDGLVDELSEISEEKRTEESKIASLEGELQEKESRIRELEDELDEARNVSDAARQMAHALSEGEPLSDLERRIVEKDDEIADLRGRVKELEAELRAKEEELAEARSDDAEDAAEDGGDSEDAERVADLEAELDATRERLDDRTERLREAREELEATRARLADAEAELEEVQAAHDVTEADHSAATDRVAELEAERDDLAETNERLRAERDALREEVDRIRAVFGTSATGDTETARELAEESTVTAADGADATTAEAAPTAADGAGPPLDSDDIPGGDWPTPGEARDTSDDAEQATDWSWGDDQVDADGTDGTGDPDEDSGRDETESPDTAPPDTETTEEATADTASTLGRIDRSAPRDPAGYFEKGESVTAALARLGSQGIVFDSSLDLATAEPNRNAVRNAMEGSQCTEGDAWGILRAVAEDGPIDAATIAPRVDASPVGVQSLLSELRSAGVVTRESGGYRLDHGELASRVEREHERQARADPLGREWPEP